MSWIRTSERLPDDETPVLVIRNGEVRIGEVRWEHPTFEETFSSFQHWDDPNDDGQIWEWFDVTHWMEIPQQPNLEEIEQAFAESTAHLQLEDPIVESVMWKGYVGK